MGSQQTGIRKSIRGQNWWRPSSSKRSPSSCPVESERTCQPVGARSSWRAPDPSAEGSVFNPSSFPGLGLSRSSLFFPRGDGNLDFYVNSIVFHIMGNAKESPRLVRWWWSLNSNSYVLLSPTPCPHHLFPLMWINNLFSLALSQVKDFLFQQWNQGWFFWGENFHCSHFLFLDMLHLYVYLMIFLCPFFSSV